MSLFEELKNVDISDVSAWSREVKLFMTAVVSVLLFIIGYVLAVKPQQETLRSKKSTEIVLKKEYKEKKALAINLSAYKQQMVEAKQTFSVLLGQLPNESEIPDLLIDITQAGVSRGLQFEQIKPSDSQVKEFYAEKAVNIKVKGSYQQIASFISDISALSRIINVDNFQLQRVVSTSSDGDDLGLSLSAVLKTYYYLADDSEV